MSDHSVIDRALTRRSVLQHLGWGAAAIGGPYIITAAQAAEAPVATTKAGKVRGYVDNGINVFKGVPYGDDTAKRRFMAAVPAKSWSGVRDCVQWGPQAPKPVAAPRQAGNGKGTPLPPLTPAGPPNPMSEDCLNLSVWTPGVNDGGKRPVMVWFHGGGYAAGSGNSPGSDGVRLCKRGDVVVVSVNHRLNIFGYFYLAELGGPEFKDSGNVGQLDLILSLEWVRDNIKNFGGDPSRVLIFGESGGGAKNACLMGMPKAMGLFQRACSSSGETVTASRPQTATERARLCLKALDLPPDNLREIKDPQKISMEKLVEASRAAGYWGPVVDGGSLPRHPFDPDANPISAHIPFMVGTNHDEARLLIGRYFDLTWDTLPETLTKYSEKMGKLDLKDVIAMYRRVYPNYSASDVFFAATTDSRDWRPAVVEIERRAALPKGSAPTYSYELDWGSPVRPELKACHALDLPFLFDNVAISHNLVGEGPEAYSLAEQISEAYIAFAKTGNPNNSKIPHWPAYDLTNRATMVFDKVSKVVNDPRSEPRKMFSQVPYENPGT
ncbi:MAG TPA: carboxylesterase/lipase family protein [Candidatus Limnocylindrales bacterium]|nr:carboxylesterase/lipase family protein [Candidatus Limnocylindrales bacterium]